MISTIASRCTTNIYYRKSCRHFKPISLPNHQGYGIDHREKKIFNVKFRMGLAFRIFCMQNLNIHILLPWWEIYWNGGVQICATSADLKNLFSGIRNCIWIKKIPSIFLDKRYELKVSGHTESSLGVSKPITVMHDSIMVEVASKPEINLIKWQDILLNCTFSQLFDDTSCHFVSVHKKKLQRFFLIFSYLKNMQKKSRTKLIWE